MKQVNMWMEDDLYAILVKMAAEEQLKTGKIVKIAHIARQLIKDSVNGHKPSDNEQEPANDAKQDAEQPAKNPFADINF